MPYTYYTKVTRDDALAIRAYLNTVPAVLQSGERGPTAISAQYARVPCSVWNELFFTPGRVPAGCG